MVVPVEAIELLYGFNCLLYRVVFDEAVSLTGLSLRTHHPRCRSTDDISDQGPKHRLTTGHNCVQCLFHSRARFQSSTRRCLCACRTSLCCGQPFATPRDFGTEKYMQRGAHTKCSDNQLAESVADGDETSRDQMNDTGHEHFTLG